MAQLLKRLGFNLTNALASHAKLFSDLLKCVICCAANAETHAQDALLTRRQLTERFFAARVSQPRLEDRPRRWL